MIYLSPKVYLYPGVDTWWEWFERNFSPTSHRLPALYKKGDVVLRYSTMGGINTHPAKSIALCWELLPELKRVFNDHVWDKLIRRAEQAAASCTHRLITSEFMRKDYSKFGKVDILPVGVDTDLFRPYSEDERLAMKKKYNIPLDREIGFWCGTTHPMKGSQNMIQYAKDNPNIYWIIVWYTDIAKLEINGQQFYNIPQKQMPELMNCADFQLSASILHPYYIIEYEGMSCNLKQRKIVDIEKDFEAGDNPREKIFEKKWDRKTCVDLYRNYINQVINE
jgi:glycosyltransferase involved in cell wall biosynthesis